MKKTTMSNSIKTNTDAECWMVGQMFIAHNRNEWLVGVTVLWDMRSSVCTPNTYKECAHRTRFQSHLNYFISLDVCARRNCFQSVLPCPWLWSVIGIQDFVYWHTLLRLWYGWIWCNMRYACVQPSSLKSIRQFINVHTYIC